MADHAHTFPISKMSTLFGVSRSGYYSWLVRSPSTRAMENARLRNAMRRFCLDSRKRDGSPRIHQQLRAEGWSVPRPRVVRAMFKRGIASRTRKKWVKTTDTNHRWPIAANLLDRNCTPKG